MNYNDTFEMEAIAATMTADPNRIPSMGARRNLIMGRGDSRAGQQRLEDVVGIDHDDLYWKKREERLLSRRHEEKTFE